MEGVVGDRDSTILVVPLHAHATYWQRLENIAVVFFCFISTRLPYGMIAVTRSTLTDGRFVCGLLSGVDLVHLVYSVSDDCVLGYDRLTLTRTEPRTLLAPDPSTRTTPNDDKNINTANNNADNDNTNQHPAAAAAAILQRFHLTERTSINWWLRPLDPLAAVQDLRPPQRLRDPPGGLLHECYSWFAECYGASLWQRWGRGGRERCEAVGGRRQRR